MYLLGKVVPGMGDSQGEKAGSLLTQQEAFGMVEDDGERGLKVTGTYMKEMREER